jgi:signal transduction histidine kinase
LAAWLRKRWNRLTLAAQFLAAAAVVVCVLMTLLGYWVNTRIEASAIRSNAEAAAIYIEAFLEPVFQDIPDQGPLPPDKVEALDALLNDVTLRRHVEALKVWRPDGTLLYGPDAHLLGQKFESDELRRAAAGEVVSGLGFSLDEEVSGEVTPPLIEVYVPLHRRGIERVVAIGEVYENALPLKMELTATRRATLGVVGLLTFSMLALLYLIVRKGSKVIGRQRTALQRRFVEATALANQNARLRQAADQARMAASRSNEALLSRVGADLHDGPIQIASLLMLKLAALSNNPTSSRAAGLSELVSDLLVELRNLSAGLVLPELENLSVEETARLAVARHKNLTGSDVAMDIGPVPEVVPQALKICVYRVIQEALNNAYQHAGGRDQVVSVSIQDGGIEIRVQDGGCGSDVETEESGRAQLGLAGLKNRVEAISGKLHFGLVPGKGGELRAILPIPNRV